MLQFTKSVFALFISVLLAAPVSAGNGDTLQNSLLWKVSGNGLSKPSYLFGTYHLMTNEFVKTVKGVNKAMKKSDAVVGEIILDDQLQAQLMPYMLMEKGTLDSLLPKAQYDSLDAALKERVGMPAAMLNKMKPMAVYTIFTATELKKSGLINESKDSKPMDLYFQDEARKKKKKVLGLETVKQQADILFGSTPLDRQAELLMDYVRKGAKDSGDQNKRMKDCYSAGRLKCLEDMMKESTYNDAETAELLDKRNNAWIPQLEVIMKEQPAFVAVGALHLTGETGMIKALRARGYTVEPVTK